LRVFVDAFPLSRRCGHEPSGSAGGEEPLLDNDNRYRELAERHHQLDDRLHELTDRHYLSTTEQVEEVTLKKKKLALKDQMEQLAREYAQTHQRAS
jgi:uncharacterized protein YdcH (DUF465 family)